MAAPTWKWFIEYTSPTQAHMHGIERFIYSGKTRYQEVEIADTEAFGRCLILDGKIQSSEKDEFIYHETLIHPPLLLHPDPRKVMILGGGEGAVVREILKHPPVERVVMCDIDQEVVRLCQEYLPGWNDGAFQDSRVELVFADARKYLEDTRETFDVIIGDLSEPLDDSPSYLLFTREFYQTVKERLGREGVIALQSGSFILNLLQCHGAVCNTLSLVFPFVCPYSSFIPSYDATWGFVLASKGLDPAGLTLEEVDRRLEERGIQGLRYYDGETHRHMFSVPRHIREAMEKDQRIIQDGRPLFTF